MAKRKSTKGTLATIYDTAKEVVGGALSGAASGAIEAAAEKALDAVDGKASVNDRILSLAGKSSPESPTRGTKVQTASASKTSSKTQTNSAKKETSDTKVKTKTGGKPGSLKATSSKSKTPKKAGKSK